MRWLALFVAVPAFALGPVLPDFLPADTKVVIGIHLRRVMESPLAKSAALHAVKLPETKVGDIDFMRDVDDILIAASSAENNEALFVMKGRFTPRPILSDPRMPKMLLAVLDSSTAIAGDAELVRAAMARRGKGALPPASLETRAAALANKYDVWGAGGQVDPVDTFSFGADFSQGLDIIGEVRLRNATDMDKINQMLKPFEAALRQQSGSSKVNFQVQGRTIRITLSVPQAELEKAIEKQKQAFTAAILQQMSPRLKITPKPKDPGQIVKDDKGDTVSVRLPGRE